MSIVFKKILKMLNLGPEMSYLFVLGKCLGLRIEIAKQLYFRSVPQINQKMMLQKEKKLRPKIPHIRILVLRFWKTIFIFEISIFRFIQFKYKVKFTLMTNYCCFHTHFISLSTTKKLTLDLHDVGAAWENIDETTEIALFLETLVMLS